MDIKRGDIYWITKNPHRSLGEHAQRPERPAIIVSGDSINRQNYAHEVVYLTTAPKTDTNTHCTIRSANKLSTALCEQVQTISNEQIGSYIGSCTKAEMDALNLCIMTSLALDPGKPEKMHTEKPELSPDFHQLTIDLEKAQHEAAIMRELYEDLLRKSLNLTSGK